VTPLQKNALARVPMAEEAVERIYQNDRGIHTEVLKALCESHERLRAELQGAEVLLADAEKEVARLKAGLTDIATHSVCCDARHEAEKTLKGISDGQ